MKLDYFRRHSFAIKFVLSYALVLIIPLVFGVAVYRESLRIVEDDVHEANVASLRQISLSIDKRIAEV